MSTNTGIQWTDATWNPIRGCSRVSEGCRHCYAEVVAARFSGPGQPYEGLARRTSKGEARWTGKVMFVEKHLEDPLRWKKPKRIFVNSMSDLFHENVTLEQLYQIFAVMMLAKQHTFQILTKRPERMRAFLNGELEKPLNGVGDSIWFAARDLVERFPKYDGELLAHSEHPVWPLANVWCGVSTEDQGTADQRIPLLLQTPAAVRFISAEPLLGPIDLAGYDDGTWRDETDTPNDSRLDWVIVGGESGPNARACHVGWVRELVATCRAADIACFVKQLGSAPIDWEPDGIVGVDLEDGHGGDPVEWPEDLRVREFPKAEALV